jgi:serine/threonine protein phosphatase PrpC
MRHSTYQIDSNDPGEDRIIVHITESMQVYCVLDGHGGGMAADMAQIHLMNQIDHKKDLIIANENDPEVVSELLIDIFIDCDQIILAACKEKSSTMNSDATMQAKFAPFKAGCCALVLLVVGTMAYVVHVGDSRAILCSTDKDSSKEISISDTDVTFTRVTMKSNRIRPFSLKSDEELKGLDLLYQEKSYAGRLRSMRGYDVGGSNFFYRGMGLFIQGITLDHTCSVEEELAVVKYLSSDPDPIRQSENDKRRFGTAAIPRVAGSLAVTRALGDAYLKRADMSLEPYSRHIPYITCVPAVSYRKLGTQDVSIILASDGFWNFIKLNEIGCLMQQQEDIETVLELGSSADQVEKAFHNEDLAKSLALKCLQNAADACRIDTQALIDMPPGPKRRGMIDDISVIVVHLPK